jgi:hypothetical protein
MTRTKEKEEKKRSLGSGFFIGRTDGRKSVIGQKIMQSESTRFVHVPMATSVYT